MTDKARVISHGPCPCGASKDNFAVYDDGHGYCFTFGCGKYVKDAKKDLTNLPKGVPLSVPKVTLKGPSLLVTNDCLPTNYNPYGKNREEKKVKENYSLQLIANYRGVVEATLKKYDVMFRVDDRGVPRECQYPYGGEAFKIRDLSRKAFHSEGDMSGGKLFGMDKFPPGSAKAITITEGENDAMSVFQMMGSKYPVVSVRSASQAQADCEANFKYLNSFDLIYLCFDNDIPGIEAAKKVATIFDVSKVRIVQIGASTDLKDANDFLVNGREEEFRKIWWNARQFLPEGVISTYNEIKDILNAERTQALCAYPFPTLNDMTYGIRSKEVVLFTAQEGIGKTELMRAIEYNALKETDYNIGIIHLEEDDKRSIQGLASYELEKPCHLPDSNVTIDQQFEAYQKLTRRDGRVFYYSHFGTDDPKGVLDVIRYLATACKCKFIFLDHITMMVTGLGGDKNGESERELLDYLSTQLAMMVHQNDFALIMVSHINDDGKTRGSRNISKVAHLHVQLDRDKLASSFDEKNTTKLTIHKNRFGYKTGDAGYLFFDPSTFILKEKTVNANGTPEQVSPF